MLILCYISIIDAIVALGANQLYVVGGNYIMLYYMI